MTTPSFAIIECPKCQSKLKIEGPAIGSKSQCPCGCIFATESTDSGVIVREEGFAESSTEGVTTASAWTQEAFAPPVEAVAPVPPAEPHLVAARVEQRASSLTLPAGVPAILKLRDGTIGVISAVVGVLLGVGVSSSLSSGGADTMVGKVFNSSNGTGVIPVAILCLFFWGIAICGFRLLRIFALESLMRKKNLTDAVAALLSDGVAPQRDLLAAHPLCEVHPLYRRLRALVDQWMQRPSLQNADIVLQKHEAVDEEAIHGGYTLVRTFIWAMPVLGLIGTVIGISLAVGGFATFLGGSVDDVTKIKTSLVDVTSGLSFAFLITLEGLLAALLTMLPTSSLQTREENLNSRIQQFLTDKYLPALSKVMPETSPKTEGGAGPLIEVWADVLKEAAAEAVQIIRGSAQAVLSDLARFSELQKVEIERWRTQLAGGMDEFANRWSGTVVELVARMEKLNAAMIQDRGDFLELEREAWKTQGEQHKELVAALADQNEKLQQAGLAVGELAIISSTALKSQEAVTQSLEQIGRLNLSDLTTVINGYTHTLSEAKSGVDDYTLRAKEVLEAQAELQKAIAQLEGTNFSTTINDLSEAVSRLTPIMKMLVRPQFVLMSGVEDAPIRTSNGRDGGTPEVV